MTMASCELIHLSSELLHQHCMVLAVTIGNVLFTTQIAAYNKYRKKQS